MNGQAPARASPGQWLQANLSWASLKSGQVDFGTEVAPDKASGSALDNTCFVATQGDVHSDAGISVITLGTLGKGRDMVAAYRESPRTFLSTLRGCGIILLIDEQAGTVLAATDRLGRTPLYYCPGQDGIAISTSLRWLSAYTGKSAIAAQELYDYVYFHMVPAPRTVFAGIGKLQAGQVLSHAADESTLSRYWQPNFRESNIHQATDPGQALYVLLKNAVSSACKDAGRTGAFLSGGLDSTTVSGLLSEIQGGNSDAYSIGFDAPGYDEMPFARASAEHFGLRLHEYYVTPEDVVSELPAIAASFEEPFGNSSALPAYFCARMAASDGIDTLLAGDGGDELFAGNARYAKQKDFVRYERLPYWLRHRIIEPLAAVAPASLPLASKARSYILQANTPLPDRMQHYSFLHQIEPETVFAPGLLSKVDRGRPLELLREIYLAPRDATDLNRMLFLDWQITLADNDLRKVDQACKLNGVRVRYPMLDDDLFEFSMGIPSKTKLPGKKLRDFYKQSLSGWLPDVTINKSKQGFGLPFGVWMREHKPLQELAYDNILKLDARKIFQRNFLEDAIARHREGHASYFGELIWVLAVLELWLSANLPDYCHE